MGRWILGVCVGLVLVTAGAAARAEQLLHVELTGGTGVTLYNSKTDSRLSPPFVDLGAAYLFLRTGAIIQGPALGLPIGFIPGTGDDETEVQVAVRPGWIVYSRPTLDLAWWVRGGAPLVVTSPFVWGLELSGSLAYFLTAGFGLTAGVQYAFFYGVDPVHTLAGQIGLVLSYEVVR